MLPQHPEQIFAEHANICPARTSRVSIGHSPTKPQSRDVYGSVLLLSISMRSKRIQTEAMCHYNGRESQSFGKTINSFHLHARRLLINFGVWM